MSMNPKNLWQKLRARWTGEPTDEDIYGESFQEYRSDYDPLESGRPFYQSGRFWRVAALGSLASGLLVAGWIYLWMRDAGIFDLDEEKLKVIIEYQHSDNSLVFDRQGKKIGEFFSNYHVYYPYKKIPQSLIDAVVSIEDRHFFQHKGIDFRGITRALFASLKTGRFTQGGSTLTQQVVRNFLLTPEKKLTRKIKEALFALQLERHMSKERIMEIYLNALFLGQGSYGAGAAAVRHFGKPLDQLDVHELALIAGLFQSPSRYNPHKSPKAAKARQLIVLQAMKDNGHLTKSELDHWKTEPLVYKSPASANAAPYFIDAIQDQTEKLLDGKVKGTGLRITTTLDLELQRQVDDVFTRSKDIFEQAAQKLVNVKNPNSRMIEAASLVLDHRTGEILALVGGRDFQRSQFNRALKAKRAPGSAFKPIVYTLGLMNGTNWSDVSYIAPVVIQNYRPQNYSNEFMTEATLYNSFYKSINTPVVELGSRLGIRKVIDMAYKLGVKTELKPQAGTLLGGSETTLLDMATVYGTLANKGERQEPYMIQRITDRNGEVIYEREQTEAEKIVPPAIAYLMTDAMQAVFRFGTASRFPEFSTYAAGKTGTTNEAKDNWFCGFTQDVTTVVWVGTDENYAFSGSVGGNTAALPIWARIMERVQGRKPARPFEMPEGVHVLRVNPHFGYEDPKGIDMPFLEGRGPTRKESALGVVHDTGSYRDALDW